MTMQDDATSSVNDKRTCQEIGTPLTRARSLDVRATIYRELLVKRNKAGAETPLGRHLSNLLQQMRNHAAETDPIARANLELFMSWTINAIRRTARTA